ncbi:AhpC/TSA family protein [Flavobacterium agricola]|uniref:AhpC/TSA family protein n=1 Tax=Flavobacterium agricola TaxID=2870839 RepID=A0ABY6LY84_9FLAO|nr:TlpA disulfide reductase family protein [Flavobacterium agricola]UYW00947.1 AhpC/TSA family protein [Flavobacterium agricola]
MMKKNLGFIVLVLFIVSCNNEPTTKIVGQVTGIPDGAYVYLKESVPSTMQLVSIDSSIIKNGKFTLALNPDEITENYLQFGDHKKLISFITEAGVIEVNFDSQNFHNNQISGTYNNNKHQEYTNKANAYIDDIKLFERENHQKLIDAQKQGNLDLLQNLNTKNQKLHEAYNNFNKEFVATNKTAYVSLVLLEKLTKQGVYTFPEAKAIFNDFSADLKNATLGKRLADFYNPENALADTSIGATFPDFIANSPTDESLSIYKNLGKVTIVDFWASWCPPCRVENPNLVKLYKDYKDSGLQIIGVSLDKNKDSWEKAIKKDKLTWPQISNLKQWDDPIVKKLGIKEIPATFLIDANGKIIAKDLKTDELRKKIAELL